MKKIYVLSALCASLIGVTSCGGKEEPVAVEPEEEATAWSDSIAYDMNGTPQSAEVNNYGQNGQIVSVNKYAKDEETKQLYKSDHVIYQGGKPIYAKNFDEKGNVIGRENYTYNEQGLITEHVLETYVEGLKRIAPSQRYIYEYNANGDVTSVKEQKTVPTGWADSYEWQYQYDAQNRVIMRMDYNGNGKERKQSCQQMWKYQDGSDRIEKIDYLFYDLKMQKLKHESKTTHEYNAKDQIVSTLVYRHKSTAKREEVKSRLISYKLNAAGQVTAVLTQKWNNGEQSWYEVGTSQYVYDQAGQLKKGTDNKYTMNKKGQQILKAYNEVHSQGAPADHPNVAPAAPGIVTKPVINLDDKRLTSKEED